MCRPKNCFSSLCNHLQKRCAAISSIGSPCITIQCITKQCRVQCNAIHSTVPMYNMVQYSTILSNIHNIVQYSTISYDIPRYRAILHLHCTIGCWASGEIKDYDEKTKSTDVSAFHNSTSATTHVCKVLLRAGCIMHISSAKSTTRRIFCKIQRWHCASHILQSVHHQTQCGVCFIINWSEKVAKSEYPVLIICPPVLLLRDNLYLA